MGLLWLRFDFACYLTYWLMFADGHIWGIFFQLLDTLGDEILSQILVSGETKGHLFMQIKVFCL